MTSDRASTWLADRIQESIRQGLLRPGDRLPPEQQLAEQYDVGRATIREALRTLEVRGLVTIRVGAGGMYVRSPDVDMVDARLTELVLLSDLQIEETVEARLLVEMGTTALAAVRASDDDIARLRQMVDEAEALLRKGHYSREQSVRFHEEVASIAGNQALSILTSSIRGPLSIARARSQELEPQRLTVAEHGRIVTALAERDAGAARRVMAEHLLRGIALPREALDALCHAPYADGTPTDGTHGA